ncbi:MAG TPA: hypothetical protein ENK70_06460, partial [Methylophaga sp.]|nr:hypothetical protein [Methylophaga sp.]
AWNSRDFEVVLKNEVKALGLDHLPLQKGLSSSSVALDHNLELIVLRTNECNNFITIKMGAFYSGIIAGCSCSDDPTPTDEVNEYCELEVNINLVNGQASVALSANFD